MDLKMICLVAAAVSFFIKGISLPTGKIDFQNIGFMFVVLSVLV